MEEIENQFMKLGMPEPYSIGTLVIKRALLDELYFDEGAVYPIMAPPLLRFACGMGRVVYDRDEIEHRVTKLQAVVRGWFARRQYARLLDKHYKPGGKGFHEAICHASSLVNSK